MTKVYCIFLIIILCCLPTQATKKPAPKIDGEAYIQAEKDPWKQHHYDSSPKTTVQKWHVPFLTKNRQSIKTISVVSTFGSHRNSYIRGHIHTGLDLIPRNRKGKKHFYVYPMAPGVVCSIHLTDPHLTVVLKHRLPDNSIIYTSYKHLHSQYLSIGQQVTPTTKLGRLYTKPEALALGGRYDHLHLEIRKSFDDYGIASWATMTKTQLNKRFIDPLKFLKEKL